MLVLYLLDVLMGMLDVMGYGVDDLIVDNCSEVGCV